MDARTQRIREEAAGALSEARMQSRMGAGAKRLGNDREAIESLVATCYYAGRATGLAAIINAGEIEEAAKDLYVDAEGEIADIAHTGRKPQRPIAGNKTFLKGHGFGTCTVCNTMRPCKQDRTIKTHAAGNGRVCQGSGTKCKSWQAEHPGAK